MGKIIRNGVSYSGGGSADNNVGVMPEPSATTSSKIVQYVGDTDENYTHGSSSLATHS